MKAVTIAEELGAEESREDTVVMTQRWSDLLFLHWRIPPEILRARLPAGLTLDTFKGDAWVGIVPFRIERAKPFGLALPTTLAAFPELNFRTYVTDRQRRPGVWFFSLDADAWLAVQVARRCFHMPYHHARINVRDDVNGAIHYTCSRRDRGDGKSLTYIWKPTPGQAPAQPGTLSHFLVERYRLFAYNSKRKRLLTARISHAPYLLSDPALQRFDTRLFEMNGFPCPKRPPDHVTASAGVDVNLHPLLPTCPK